MRNRILFSDYAAKLTDRGWTLSDQQGYKRVFTRDGETLVVTVCRNVRGALFVTHAELPSAADGWWVD